MCFRRPSCAWPAIGRGWRAVENLVAYVFAIARNEAARLIERRGREGRRRTELASRDPFIEGEPSEENNRETAELVAVLAGEARPSASRDRGAEDLRSAHLPGDQRGDRTAAGNRCHPVPVRPGEDAWSSGEGAGMSQDIERLLHQRDAASPATGIA